ncbi:MAG: SDR family oxidoreductase [Acidobacteriaceae bacterium]|nr:SDR family oxidoreductase [Acidobacteriaceae bacterium]
MRSDDAHRMPTALKKTTRSNAGPWFAAAGLFAAAFAARRLTRRGFRPEVEFSGKVVLIAGGTDGLSLALANEFGAHGAHIGLCAGDGHELQSARDRLAARNIESTTFVADVSKQPEIDSLVERVLSHYGRIDMLVNSGGKIAVGPLESFTKADFDQTMNLIFRAPVNLTLAFLPLLRKQRAGNIINIASVGGRVSLPHLLPYSCAESAFLGFSTGLSSELKPQGIDVLTVVPGFMGTASSLNAEFRGYSREDYTWFELLGSLPGFSVAADRAAVLVREAVEKRKHMCTISQPARLLAAADAIFPEATRDVLDLTSRFLLPGSTSEDARIGKLLNPTLQLLFRDARQLGRSAPHDVSQ